MQWVEYHKHILQFHLQLNTENIKCLKWDVLLFYEKY